MSLCRDRRYFRPVQFDALVILGCRILPGGELSAAARRRVQATAAAFLAGRAPRVVVSGGRRWHGVSEAEALMRELEKLGVPAPLLVPELCSLSTCENARNVARLLASRGPSKVGVVTCDWHMARALRSFRLAGLDAAPVAAPSPETGARERALRSARERVSFWLDRFATFGWAAR